MIMELQKGDKVIITNGIYKDIEGTIISCSKLGFYLVEPVFKLLSKHFTENELKKIQ